MSLLTLLSMSQIQIFDTTIKIKSNTRDRLKKLGNLSYTYDRIISELLDEYEEKNQ